jgi:glucan phosphoethanolaminetransferase (alkaline phosphatase superfamily)
LVFVLFSDYGRIEQLRTTLFLSSVRNSHSQCKMAGPALWLCFSFTLIHLSITFWGALRFQEIMSFCQSVNRTHRYPYVKMYLLLSLYAFVPLALISITLMWVGYDQGWQVAYFFLILPFFALVGFVAIVLVTKNDVSNFVDIQRAARSRLPFQPIPPPLAVGLAAGSAGHASPSRHATVPIPPTLPVRDGNVVDDDDAF